MRVRCINDSNKPSDIPDSKWIIKDLIYTVVDEFKALPEEVDTYILSEIDLEGTAYGGFSADRFDIDITDELAIINLEILNRTMKDEL